MPLELSRLHSLRCGPYLTSVHVGDIPEIISASFGTGFRSVHLSRKYYEKIVGKHKDLTDYDFLQLPYILKHGLWIGESKEPDCRLVCSPIPDSDQRYKVIVRKLSEDSVLWVSTFHKTRPRATRSFLKRGPILRFFTE